MQREDDKQLLSWIETASRPLRKTQCRNLKVSALDTPLLMQRVWSRLPSGYVHNNTGYLHRVIMQPGKGLEIDHINRDRSDNRRENLRCVTRSQNHYNKRSKRGACARGVTFEKKTGRYDASVKDGAKARYLGTFDTEAEAAEVASKARMALIEDSKPCCACGGTGWIYAPKA